MKVQERAKPLLIPLFQGEFCTLNRTAQGVVAAWITMAAMNSEYLGRNPDAIVTTQRERYRLMKQQAPPNNWRIWIGRYKRQAWKGQWVRVTGTTLKAKDIPRAVELNRRRPNEQAITFVVGALYVTLISGAHPTVTAAWDWRTAPRARNSLVQIWPIVSELVPFGLVDITDNDAQAFATAYKQWSDAVARESK